MIQRPTFSVYAQGQHPSNLSRLLLSLSQARIFHVLLEPKVNNQTAELSNSVIKILVSQAGLEKIHQVFVGQRFISLGMDKQNLFWDTRTGITLEICLSQDLNPQPVQYRLADPAIPDEMY